MKNECSSIEHDDMLEVTEQKLIEWSSCSSGKNWFLEKFPHGGMFDAVYAALREDRRYQDGDWLADKVFSQLDAKAKTEQLVSITGANKAKIAEQAKKCGAKEGEIATTGDWANAATTGDRANAATTGDKANAATTGYRADAATTGDKANAATTGYRANAATSGEHAISAALGYKSKAKAGIGGAIVLCHRNADGELIHIRCSKVGENGIKPDAWYSLDADGEFVEKES